MGNQTVSPAPSPTNCANPPSFMSASSIPPRAEPIDEPPNNDLNGKIKTNHCPQEPTSAPIMPRKVEEQDDSEKSTVSKQDPRKQMFGRRPLQVAPEFGQDSTSPTIKTPVMNYSEDRSSKNQKQNDPFELCELASKELTRNMTSGECSSSEETEGFPEIFTQSGNVRGPGGGDDNTSEHTGSMDTKCRKEKIAEASIEEEIALAPPARKARRTRSTSLNSRRGSLSGGDRSRRSSVAAKNAYPAPGCWRLCENQLLGHGAYGQAFLGLNTLNGEFIAVKRLSIPDDDIEEEICDSLDNSWEATTKRLESSRTRRQGPCQLRFQDVQEEIELMRVLEHQNISRYLGAELHQSTTASTLYVLQEWAPGGSIGSLVDSFGALEPRVQRRYVRSILRGLVFLHDNSVVHGDLKPENVLLDNHGECKLSDFGAAKRLQRSAVGALNEAALGLKDTSYYMSPEQMKQEGGGPKSDVWSLGGVALFMATAESPWTDTEGFEDISSMSVFAFIGKVICLKETTPITRLSSEKSELLSDPSGSFDSPPLLPFLECCFVRDPEDRASSYDLLRAIRAGGL